MSENCKSACAEVGFPAWCAKVGLTPKEGSAVVNSRSSDWKGVRMTPQHAKAAMRLELLTRFPPDARDWEKTSEHTPIVRTDLRRRTDDVYKSMTGKFMEPASFDRIYTNEYGLVGVEKCPSPTIAAVLELVDQTFASPISTRTALSLDGMDVVVHYEKPGDDEQLRSFQDTYAGFVDILRMIEIPTIDTLALISQYDGWVAHLMAWAADEGDDVAAPGGRSALIEAIKLASRSSYKLRYAVAEEKDEEETEEVGENGATEAKSPLFSLYWFQKLSNEIQLECIRSSIAEKHTEDLKNKLSSEQYFERARRFNELFNWRVTEMMHALRTACVAGNREQRAEFGLRLVRAISRVVDIESRGDKYTKPDNPAPAPPREQILKLRAPLFEGDPSPHTLIEFKAYLANEHRDVLAEFSAEKTKPPSKRETATVPAP